MQNTGVILTPDALNILKNEGEKRLTMATVQDQKAYIAYIIIIPVFKRTINTSTWCQTDATFVLAQNHSVPCCQYGPMVFAAPSCVNHMHKCLKHMNHYMYISKLIYATSLLSLNNWLKIQIALLIYMYWSSHAPLSCGSLLIEFYMHMGAVTHMVTCETEALSEKIHKHLSINLEWNTN